MKLPEIVQEYGYPTEEFLEWIRQYDPRTNEVTLEKFLKEILPMAFWVPDWCINWTDDVMNISTGGWSGNEDIMHEIFENYILSTQMNMVGRKSGGHYKFKPEIE